MIKIADTIIAILIIIMNFYFIKASISIILSGGGGMGFGLIFLPISVSINLLLIPAFLAILKKVGENSFFLLTINSLGLFWSLFWFYQIHLSYK